MEKMKKSGKYEQAGILEDLVPLFEPHQFWDSQPVQQPTDVIGLDENDFDKPIENKQVSDVSQEPY